MEEVLARELAARKDLAVMAVADEKRGESLIVVTNHPGIDQKSVRETLKAGGFSDLAVPRRVVFMKDIPKLGTGEDRLCEIERPARSFMTCGWAVIFRVLSAVFWRASLMYFALSRRAPSKNNGKSIKNLLALPALKFKSAPKAYHPAGCYLERKPLNHRYHFRVIQLPTRTRMPTLFWFFLWLRNWRFDYRAKSSDHWQDSLAILHPGFCQNPS